MQITQKHQCTVNKTETRKQT